MFVICGFIIISPYLILYMALLCILAKLRRTVITSHFMIMIHGFLPDSMMVTVIAPILKNKAGNLSDNNNYRPIALATVASKLFESFILSRVSTLLTTCANQC